MLKGWLESYESAELFDGTGAIRPEVTAFMPAGELRIGANPNANGGLLRAELELPSTEDYAVELPGGAHGWSATEATAVLGKYTAELIRRVDRLLVLR